MNNRSPNWTLNTTTGGSCIRLEQPGHKQEHQGHNARTARTQCKNSQDTMQEQSGHNARTARTQYKNIQDTIQEHPGHNTRTPRTKYKNTQDTIQEHPGHNTRTPRTQPMWVVATLDKSSQDTTYMDDGYTDRLK